MQIIGQIACLLAYVVTLVFIVAAALIISLAPFLATCLLACLAVAIGIVDGCNWPYLLAIVGASLCLLPSWQSFLRGNVKRG